VAGGHEEAAAAVAHDEAGDRRIGIDADADDQVLELADRLAGLSLDRPVEDGCEEEHRPPPEPSRAVWRGGLGKRGGRRASGVPHQEPAPSPRSPGAEGCRSMESTELVQQ
jgi:hypothetical protein